MTVSFVMAAVGAFYALRGVHTEHARVFLRVGVAAGLVASVLVAFPAGDLQAKLVAEHQPVTLAAMEGRFESGGMAGINVIDQPNVPERRLDNPIHVPGVLSWLAYGQFHSNVRGLDEFPDENRPDNIELLYYWFHVMVGLGTLFILLMTIAALLEWRGRLVRTRPVLWILMTAFPFPYIANTAGWMTTELGRQPWLVYGILRTVDGASPTVHAGTALFSLIGFTGLYFVLGLLFLFLVGREIAHGPRARQPAARAADRRGGLVRAALVHRLPDRRGGGNPRLVPVLVGVFALLAIVGHSGSYLARRTEGAVYARSRRAAIVCYAVVTVIWPVVTLATAIVNRRMYEALPRRPLAWLALAVALGGLIAVALGLRANRPLRVFLGSSAYLAGLLGATAALIFPVMLCASGSDDRSLTAYTSAVPAASLRIALGWWVVAAPLAVTYFVILFRVDRGKAAVPREGEGY